MPTYLAIGHLTLDRLPRGLQPGGTVLYAACQAQAFGYEARILTSASHESLDPVPEVLSSVDIHNVPATRSTTFEYVWMPLGRRQKLTARAQSLTSEQVPVNWNSSDIWHLAPVAAELSSEIWRDAPQSAFLGITPQGWLRETDEAMIVRPGYWRPSEALLSRADAIVVSEADVENADELAQDWSRQRPVVAVTAAEAGVRIYQSGRVTRFAPFSVTAQNELGAGDVFAATLFVSLASGFDVGHAGAYANATAATFVSLPEGSLSVSARDVENTTGLTLPQPLAGQP